MPLPVHDLHEPAPSGRQRPLERAARVESDLFCENCGYNLHSLPVVRDERLGILVVRCTECGRFAPAAVASSASRVWLNRLAVTALACWVLAALAFTAFSAVALGAMQVASVEVLTHGTYVTPEGVPVYRTWDPATAKMVWRSLDRDAIIAGEPGWQRTWRPRAELYAERGPLAVLAFFFIAIPTSVGALFAVMLWHVARRRYLLLILLPALAAVVVVSGFHAEQSRGGERTGMVLGLVLSAAVVQAVLLLAGTRLGRPVARWLVSLIIPPGPRQALSFLWICDGLPAPALRPR